MAKKAEKPWDICEDFLEPMAKLLSLPPAEQEEAAPTGPELEEWGETLFKPLLVVSRPFAFAWLQVNVSDDVAQHVQHEVNRAIILIAGGDSEDTVVKLARRRAGRLGDLCDIANYLRNLALVIRQKQGETVTASDIPTGPRTQPMTKKCIAEIFVRGRNNITEEFLAGKYAEQDGLRYHFPVAIMPEGWRAIFQKHQPNRKK